MSRIRSKDTKPEIIVRKHLFSKGFRYRIHVKNFPGKPDIVLRKYKTVIFVHGCFWHGHDGCKYYTVPKTRTEWWMSKINNNIIRDKNAEALLRLDGWNIITVWECELKNKEQFQTLNLLTDSLKNKLK